MTTKKLVPRASGEGAMGVDDNAWGEAYYDTGNFNKGLFVSGHNITQVIAETVTQGGLGGEWTRNGLDIYYNGGNVGIGVTNPSQKLDIHGKFTVNGDGTALWGNIPNGITGRLSWDGGATGKIILRAEANNTLNLGANGSHNHIVIDTNGNVGIGTTNPGGKLEVAEDNSENCSIRLRSNSQNGTILGALTELKSIGTNSTYGTDFTISNRDASDSFKERIRLVYNGNVGIGTTNPSALLEAYKDSSDEYDDFSYAIPVLKITNANTTAAKPHSLIAFRLDKNGGDGYLGFITEGSTANTQHFVLGGQGSGEHLRINSNGNVGIGTTSPTNALNVIRSSTSGVPVAWLHNSNNTTTGNFGTVVSCVNNNPSVNVFQVRSNNSTHTNGNGLFTVKGDGNVGIGTADPEVIHHISTATQTDNYAVTRLTADSQQFDVGVGGSSAAIAGVRNKFYIYDSTDGSLSATRLVIDGAGNVGIGTPDPSSTLTVSRLDQNETNAALSVYRSDTSPDHRPTAPIFNLFNGTGGSSEVFRVQGNGNVGIGTTTPSEKLEVRGHLRFGPTAYGSVREGSIMNLPQNGFYDLLLHNAFQGFLIVSITSTGNANIRTYATYSVFGRGSDFSFTLITSENGAVGGVAFALSRNSTTGAIRLSNASNLTCQSTMVFYGSTSF